MGKNKEAKKLISDVQKMPEKSNILTKQNEMESSLDLDHLPASAKVPPLPAPIGKPQVVKVIAASHLQLVSFSALLVAPQRAGQRAFGAMESGQQIGRAVRRVCPLVLLSWIARRPDTRLQSGSNWSKRAAEMEAARGRLYSPRPATNVRRSDVI